MATTVLSDHEYNEGSQTYIANTDASFIKRAVAYTDYLDAKVPLSDPIPMANDLGLTEALPDTAITITVVGVLFYKEVNGTYLAMKSEQALEVLHVA